MTGLGGHGRASYPPLRLGREAAETALGPDRHQYTPVDLLASDRSRPPPANLVDQSVPAVLARFECVPSERAICSSIDRPKPFGTAPAWLPQTLNGERLEGGELSCALSCWRSLRPATASAAAERVRPGSLFSS